MYEGNNPTALNSRKWLVNALMALMEEQPYAQITVKAICKKADLSRQTFYNFFPDKDDIIRFCIRRCYAEMMNRLQEKPAISLADITEELTSVFRRNQKLMNLVVSHELNQLLETELTSAIREFARQMNPENESQTSRYGTAFLCGAIAHTVIYWFRDADPLSAEQLSALLAEILSGNYYQIHKSSH